PASEDTAPAPARAARDRLWVTGLPNVLTLARRDLAALFLSPIAYVVGTLVIVPTSVFGYLLPLAAGGPVSMAGVFSWVAFSMAFLAPLVTMRLLAGERGAGTLEQLLAAPLRDWELIVGKWLAGFVCFLAATAFTLAYVVLIAAQQPHGAAVDYGAVATGYLGLVLLGAAWVALGLLVSGLTGSQLVAAVAGIVVLLAFQYLFGTLAGFVAPPLSDLLEYVSAPDHAQSFDQGQVVLRDVVYFATLTIAPLVLATRVAALRRSW
ncbi:MAG TPA: ABC transporter permease, partial [Candidatus Dormibacteraeota bacterium]|nr:ABC transporter permease [Candidatus Dormibacteraeota bacterium]